MQISRSDEANLLRLALSGRFDFHSHKAFRTAYEQALDSEHTTRIEVDFSGVDYLDSSALGMLLLLREKADTCGKSVVLTGLQGTVKEVIQVANFGKLFTIQA